MLAGYYLVIRINRGLKTSRDLDERAVLLGTKHPIFLEIRFGIPGPSQFDGPESDGSREAGRNLWRENILRRDARRFHHVALVLVVNSLHVIQVGLTVFGGGVHVVRFIRGCQQGRLFLLLGFSKDAEGGQVWLVPGEAYSFRYAFGFHIGRFRERGVDGDRDEIRPIRHPAFRISQAHAYQEFFANQTLHGLLGATSAGLRNGRDIDSLSAVGPVVGVESPRGTGSYSQIDASDLFQHQAFCSELRYRETNVDVVAALDGGEVDDARGEIQCGVEWLSHRTASNQKEKQWGRQSDRKSTRLNSSHLGISY